MNARNALQWIFATFAVLRAAACPVLADPLRIYGNDFNLNIPAKPNQSKGWMAPAIVKVPDHFTVQDLDISISLTHTNVFDLQIYLQGPAGTRLCINMYDAFEDFFVGADYTRTVFDDEAQTPIEQGRAPFAGRFRPKTGSRLNIFEGRDAHGLWRLQVYDAFEYDTGTFDKFELVFNSPEPATAILLVVGAGLIRLFRPNRKTLAAVGCLCSDV